MGAPYIYDISRLRVNMNLQGLFGRSVSCEYVMGRSSPFIFLIS